MKLEATLLILIVLGIFAYVIYLRVRETRYLKKKTSETFSKGLREEIEKEREDTLRKKKKFEETLKHFGGGE